MGLLSVFIAWLPQLVTLAVALFSAAYFYLSYKMSYWRSRGVPDAEPSLIFGNLKESTLQRMTLGHEIREIYRKLDGHRFGGLYFFHRPVLIFRDPELIRTIFVKEFSHFVNHDNPIDEDVDPLQARNLFALGDQKWRNMRIKLSPTFTSGKMKKMFQFVCDCADQLQRYVEDYANKGKALEIRDILSRYTTDVIATCAFGIQLNSIENPDSELRKMARTITDPFGFFEGIKFLLLFSFPAVSKFFRISFTKQEVTDFFRRTVKETFDYREKNHIVRNDFIDMLIKLKNTGKVEDEEDNEGQNGHISTEDSKLELTHDDLTAQVLIFFIGGYETSSTLLNFVLLELALNPEIQKKLHEEVDQTLEKTEGKLLYQTVMHDMTYLEQVVSETLRKHPPLTVTDRVCTKPFTIPDSDMTIEVGTVVEIPIYALHHDPNYFPDPDKFDPERFNEENKKKIHPYTYLPFGEGPRQCIGMRFAFMQSKVCLVSLLSKYQVNTCDKTSNPYEFAPNTFFLAVKGGTWLQLVKRSNE